AQRSLHHDSNGRMKPTKLGEHAEQVKRGEFVGAHYEPALLQLAKLRKRFFRVIAQVQQALSVFLEDSPSVGKSPIARGRIKQCLADFELPLDDRAKPRRLRALEIE